MAKAKAKEPAKTPEAPRYEPNYNWMNKSRQWGFG